MLPIVYSVARHKNDPVHYASHQEEVETDHQKSEKDFIYSSYIEDRENDVPDLEKFQNRRESNSKYE